VRIVIIITDMVDIDEGIREWRDITGIHIKLLFFEAATSPGMEDDAGSGGGAVGDPGGGSVGHAGVSTVAGHER